MDSTISFQEKLFAALDDKTAWYDSIELPKILAAYRDLHTYMENLTQTLLKKGVIKEDPYKHDKKISDIALLDESDFSDNDRQMKISIRLSDFNSMLDFICNYLKFSVSTFTADRIKKLVAFNNYFQWDALTVTATKKNTRVLAEILLSVRQGTDALSAKVVNDSISNAAKCIKQINASLEILMDFQREAYKGEVRKKVLSHPSFSAGQAAASHDNAMQQIKKLFPSALGKFPFYPELIDEIIKEEYSSDKNSLQEKLLQKLSVQQKTETKKNTQVNTKNMLMDAVRSVAAAGPHLEQITAKIEENKEILDSENNGIFEKIKKAMRKAFNIQEPPITYRLALADSLSQSHRTETIVIQDFITDLKRRCRYYAAFSLKKTPGYQKIEAMPDDKIMDMISAQLSECQHLLVTLNALDSFFKSTAQPLD